MSMQHCEHCNKGIDTDFNAEHFEENELGETLCQEDQQDNPVWLADK